MPAAELLAAAMTASSVGGGAGHCCILPCLPPCCCGAETAAAAATTTAADPCCCAAQAAGGEAAGWCCGALHCWGCNPIEVACAPLCFILHGCGGCAALAHKHKREEDDGEDDSCCTKKKKNGDKSCFSDKKRNDRCCRFRHRRQQQGDDTGTKNNKDKRKTKKKWREVVDRDSLPSLMDQYTTGESSDEGDEDGGTVGTVDSADNMWTPTAVSPHYYSRKPKNDGIVGNNRKQSQYHEEEEGNGLQDDDIRRYFYETQWDDEEGYDNVVEEGEEVTWYESDFRSEASSSSPPPPSSSPCPVVAPTRSSQGRQEEQEAWTYALTLPQTPPPARKSFFAKRKVLSRRLTTSHRSQTLTTLKVEGIVLARGGRAGDQEGGGTIASSPQSSSAIRCRGMSEVLCRYLEENPDTVRGKHVLELGSDDSRGLCGIVAYHLGSRRTVLTFDPSGEKGDQKHHHHQEEGGRNEDDDETVLSNLRSNLHSNLGSSGGATSPSSKRILSCRTLRWRRAGSTRPRRGRSHHESYFGKDELPENKVDTVLFACPPTGNREGMDRMFAVAADLVRENGKLVLCTVATAPSPSSGRRRNGTKGDDAFAAVDEDTRTFLEESAKRYGMQRSVVWRTGEKGARTDVSVFVRT